jgi:hypothetical protein
MAGEKVLDNEGKMNERLQSLLPSWTTVTRKEPILRFGSRRKV